jgi:hypothetical protein
LYFYVPKWIKKKSDKKENSVRRVKSIYSKHFKNCGNESKIRLHMDQVICTFTNYVVYSIQMDQVICTCTYVELKSLQMDKVICITFTNYVVYFMKIDQIICTCTYVELKSFQIDKVICTSTNYFIYSMQMAKVICIILQSFSPFQQINWIKNKITKKIIWIKMLTVGQSSSVEFVKSCLKLKSSFVSMLKKNTNRWKRFKL